MKILLTDVFLRKSFDVINILLNYFEEDELIFTLDNQSTTLKLKLFSIYRVRHFKVLRKSCFTEDLISISKNFSSEEIVFLPIEEDMTHLFLKFTENESFNFKYLLPNIGEYNLSRNKKDLNLFCENNNISSPKFITKEVLENGNFQYPIIKKPKLGSGAKGIIYIENEEDLKSCQIDFEYDFVQERLPNPKDVQAGFYLCKDGKVISFYSHKRIRTFPETGGVTVFSKAENNSDILELGSQLLGKLNWSGVAMAEFIYDERDKKYKLIEINPRLWGSIMLSEFCNSKFLINYINGSLGKKIIKNEVNTNRYIRWIFPYDVFYCIKTVSNPFLFFKKRKNTCYINFSYTNTRRSLLLILLTYFDLSKISKLFQNEK